MQYSEHLQDAGETDCGSVAFRVRLYIEDSYKLILDLDPVCDRFSLLFVGWSREGYPLVWRITTTPSNPMDWIIQDLNGRLSIKDQPPFQDDFWLQHRTYFVGNGQADPVKQAQRFFCGSDPTDPLRGYKSLLHVIDDRSESNVGGAPQVAIITPSGCEILGILDDERRRFLLGQRVGTGPPKQIRFFPRDLSGLVLNPS